MIVAGFGFRDAATDESFADALSKAGAPDTLDAVATLARKAPELGAFAEARGLSLKAVSLGAARAQTTVTQSAASFAQTGIHSVAEATALAAAGPGARLLGARVVSFDRRATCAIALGGHHL